MLVIGERRQKMKNIEFSYLNNKEVVGNIYENGELLK